MKKHIYLSIFSLLLTASPATNAKQYFYSQPEPIQTAIDKGNALSITAFGRTHGSAERVDYDEKTEEFFFKRQDKRAAVLYYSGAIDDETLVSGLSHRFYDDYMVYKNETNPLRARKMLRNKLIPLAKSIAAKSQDYTISETYFFYDLLSSFSPLNISYDPVGLSIETRHFLGRNCENADAMHSFSPDHFQSHSVRTNPLNTKLAFYRPAGCEVFWGIDDEDFAIDVIDDIQASNVFRRAIFKLESQKEPSTSDLKSVINSKLVGFALMKMDKDGNKSVIAYSDVNDSQKAGVSNNSRVDGASTSEPLNINCKIEDYEGRGFLVTTGFSAKQFVGNIDGRAIIDRISTTQTANTDYEINVAARTPTNLVLHQKASTGNVVSTYDVSNQYLHIDIDLPTGVSMTTKMAKDGFCEIIDAI